MKKICLALSLAIILGVGVSGQESDLALTYAVYPYLPDAGYYQEVIEERWAELEPDIPLIRAEWDCYTDGEPEGIDVIMFDAVMLDEILSAGWIQSIEKEAVWEVEDLYPFALEGLTGEEGLSGIPVFLCGNFLIYDEDCEALRSAEHLPDLGEQAEILVINSENPERRHQYFVETLADSLGEANPSLEGVEAQEEETLELMDRLAVAAHRKDDDIQVALAYDGGIGQGYVGFSESMRLLQERAEKTQIKTISFSDQPDTARLYLDAVAITAGVQGERYEKCLELANVCAEAEVLRELSVQDGEPVYLLLPRKSPYALLSDSYPLYARLEELASREENHVIRTP